MAGRAVEPDVVGIFPEVDPPEQSEVAGLVKV